MDEFEKRPIFNSEKSPASLEEKQSQMRANLEKELEYLKENKPEDYEKARNELDELNRQLNSEQFRQSMSGLANFFQNLSQGFAGFSQAQKDEISSMKVEAVNPFKDQTFDIDLDPRVISFLFSLDGKGFDDYSINDIKPIADNPTDKKQWNIMTNPFKYNDKIYKNLFEELFRLNEDTQDFYKKGE